MNDLQKQLFDYIQSTDETDELLKVKLSMAFIAGYEAAMHALRPSLKGLESVVNIEMVSEA